MDTIAPGARRGGRAAVFFILAGALLASCTDGGTATPPPSTITATTASATATTTQTSAVDPLAETRADLERAHGAVDAAYLRAVEAPKDEAQLKALLRLYVPGAAAARDISTRVKTLARQGYAAQAGPRGYFVIEDITVGSVAEGAKASLTVCTFDDGILIDTRHKAPNGKPVIVNDAVASGRTVETWIRRGSAWLLQGGTVKTNWPGVNKCPPKPQ